MNILKNDIKSAVSNKCECSYCIHGNHSIIFKNCHDAIKKLKQSKSDGCTGILSDHIIHASDKLTCSVLKVVLPPVCVLAWCRKPCLIWYIIILMCMVSGL